MLYLLTSDFPGAGLAATIFEVVGPGSGEAPTSWPYSVDVIRLDSAICRQVRQTMDRESPQVLESCIKLQANKTPTRVRRDGRHWFNLHRTMSLSTATTLQGRRQIS
jgi:hypothetical protein